MYVNHLSSSYRCYHTHCLISALLRTHTPTIEMRNTTPNDTWCSCWWDVVLCLGDCAFEVVGRCIDVGDWMFFRTHIENAIDLEEFNWRSPERVVYKLSSHSTYEKHTSVTQLSDKPFNEMPIRALNCMKTYIPVAPPRVENGWQVNQVGILQLYL